MDIFVWGGIGLCLAHSGLFSGLNLALIGVSRLRLEAEARGGNPGAEAILALRRDTNLLLTTLLWGNVGVNVLLTMLSESVLAGVSAFAFSTFGITLFGEIAPQAYFSRHAMRAGSVFSPVVRFYQLLLYPIAKPTALLLDRWLGPESIQYFEERDLRKLIELHTAAHETDLGHAEGLGALNFLDLDDLPLSSEGATLHPDSVIEVKDALRLPPYERTPSDPFVRAVQASGKKWVVLVDRDGEPGLVLDADGFLRGALLEGDAFEPEAHCHHPVLVRDPTARLAGLLGRFHVQPVDPEDDVVDRDLILLWTPGQHRVMTGADVLGRLLRGIATRDETLT